MTLTHQLAKNFRELHFGGNWTWASLKEVLSDITKEEAMRKVDSYNTIAALVYHINYFVDVVLKVLRGGKLEGDDKVSFNHPAIVSDADWQWLLNKVWKDAEEFAGLLEKLPDDKLWENIGPEKYGSYYRNIQGIIEHSYYHLGQVVILKKMIRTTG